LIKKFSEEDLKLMSLLCLNAFLQQWHGLSGFELEKQCIDRISFRKFLGFFEYIPSNTIIWSFGKRIIDNCKKKEI
jgi:IS5 family transposase